MLHVTRVDSRRVFVLGVAGLVPAALVTLFLVHQPSIGARRLYPMVRGSLALIGLVLALATVITWATAPNRLSRSSLCGLAWAGVTLLLCIGPFLESTPRARLYALQLETGDVAWASTRIATPPVYVEPDLVVTDVKAGSFVGLDPMTGVERWRHRIADARTEPLVAQAMAAGAHVPEAHADRNNSAGQTTAEGLTIVDGHVERPVDGDTDGDETDRQEVLLQLPAERVLAIARFGDSAYAYVSTLLTTSAPVGTIVKFDVDSGDVRWRMPLPEDVAAATGVPAVGANADVVVVAGGERIAAFDATSGEPRWTESVVTLGKSRGYALPGAVQRVIVTDTLVFLSATPDT